METRGTVLIAYLLFWGDRIMDNLWIEGLG